MSIDEKFAEFAAYVEEEKQKLKETRRDAAKKLSRMERISSVMTPDGRPPSEEFVRFLKKPYKLKRISGQKYHVYVPKYVGGFEAGWLIDEGRDDEYRTYEITRYSSWLGTVPKEIADRIIIPRTIRATVSDGTVQFDDVEAAKKLFAGHVRRWNDGSATIRAGHEWNVILSIIEDGGIPYKKSPVDTKDQRRPEVNYTLYDYQKKAAAVFKRTGAAGVFFPTGSGKSFIAMHCMDSVRGRKIVVTKKILISQWTHYMEKYAPRLVEETDLYNYEYLRSHPEILKKRYALAVYDECHRLPARSFARLSMMNCRYRLGLSASPHREDGNEKMIFALTGFPVGLDWGHYMRTARKKYHPVTVHVVKNPSQKTAAVRSLLDITKKTVIFCDGLALGKKLSARIGVPFVHGASRNRMETILDSKICIVSRVGDEGMSIGNLERIIEADFMFGSRGQEVQRTGRLMHSTGAERHDIVMTAAELESYGKRIWILQDKGFRVKVTDWEKK